MLNKIKNVLNPIKHWVYSASTTKQVENSILIPIQWNTNIAIINQSKTLSDTQVSAVLPALQIQINRDYSIYWNTGANLKFFSKNEIVPVSFWKMYILDNSDQQGALGYHEYATNGIPMGKMFAADDIKYGLSWTVTLSHEILEMLTDPNINLTVFSQNSNTAGTLYAYEVCDSCEADQFAYDINGVKVSDFVYPTWFEDWRLVNSTKFDHMGHITAPFQLLSGGYIGLFNVTTGSGWQQKTAESFDGSVSRLVNSSRVPRRK